MLGSYNDIRFVRRALTLRNTAALGRSDSQAHKGVGRNLTGTFHNCVRSRPSGKFQRSDGANVIAPENEVPRGRVIDAQECHRLGNALCESSGRENPMKEGQSVSGRLVRITRKAMMMADRWVEHR